jgi:hypothetical protein
MEGTWAQRKPKLVSVEGTGDLLSWGIIDRMETQYVMNEWPIIRCFAPGPPPNSLTQEMCAATPTDPGQTNLGSPSGPLRNLLCALVDAVLALLG